VSLSLEFIVRPSYSAFSLEEKAAIGVQFCVYELVKILSKLHKNIFPFLVMPEGRFGATISVPFSKKIDRKLLKDVTDNLKHNLNRLTIQR